jgi:DNA modification methylase
MKDRYKLFNSDCCDAMRNMAAGTVDSIVTDPPYELGFMGKAWDATGVAYKVEVWKECLRVLKPGGHLLAFGGSRTYHRLACAVEDAGFEIRDQIMWVYGSGFPKSLDVSKAIDKCNGEAGRLYKFTEWMRSTGITAQALNEATSTNMGGHYLTSKSQPAIPTATLWAKIRPLCQSVPAWVDDLVQRVEAEREIIGYQDRGKSVNTGFMSGGNNITAPSTEAARQWNGWGTALKPAHEPIVVARKPLEGTVAENVLKHGTGAINVDACRVGTSDDLSGGTYGGAFSGSRNLDGTLCKAIGSGDKGRWPANFIHDGSGEVLELFPYTKCGRLAVGHGSGNSFGVGNNNKKPRPISSEYGNDSGSAARFFYCAKASRGERDAGLEEFDAKRDSDRNSDDLPGGDNPRNRTNTARRNHHPTVKPIALMRYLVRLVTPPGGLVLDPFTGSGTTGLAALREGMAFVGCEQSEDYIKIATARLRAG